MTDDRRHADAAAAGRKAAQRAKERAERAAPVDIRRFKALLAEVYGDEADAADVT